MSRKPEREPQQEKPLRIRFGHEFESTHPGRAKYVIVDVGDENYCSASEVMDVHGQEGLGIAGTTGREDIRLITDRWSLQRIERAFATSFGHGSRNGRFFETLRSNSKRKPRILPR